jgi:hypothetical protein
MLMGASLYSPLLKSSALNELMNWLNLRPSRQKGAR